MYAIRSYYDNGDDEISDLVVQFNQMVDELALSAEMLSRNQRDMAWREMARQIALAHREPDLLGVVLHPPRLRVVLREVDGDLAADRNNFV